VEEYGPLQQIPPGLLGMLQLKNEGKSPQTFGSLLQPSLDLLKWYLQARAVDAPYPMSIARTNGQTGAAAWTTNPFTVPQQQWIYVHEYTVIAGGLIGTDTVQGMPTAFDAVLGVLRTFGQPTQPPLTGSAATRVYMANVRDFFLPPGTQLSVSTNVNETATSITWLGYVRYTPLPI
jgi:hypothetical protein